MERVMPDNVYNEVHELYSLMTDEQLQAALERIEACGLLAAHYVVEDCGCIYGTFILATDRLAKFAFGSSSIYGSECVARQLRAEVGLSLHDIDLECDYPLLTPAEQWLVSAIEPGDDGQVNPDEPHAVAVANVIRDIQSERATKGAK